MYGIAGVVGPGAEQHRAALSRMLGALGHRGPDVVANGAIYGHNRIRDRHRHYPYRSGSDIEVVPTLHHAHGAEFLAHLPGTSALALLEQGSRHLTLASGGHLPPYAQAVADRHGIDLHVFRPEGVDLVEALHDVAQIRGEPLGDSSTVPTVLRAVALWWRHHRSIVAPSEASR